MRNLYNLGYNADKVREIFRWIDWMMSLREDLSQKFEHKLSVLEEDLKMPYVTSVERIAEARGEALGKARGEAIGEARGKLEGGASVLFRQLAKAHGPVSDELQHRIRQLPMERLEALGKALLDFRSLQDVQAWLDAHDESKD